MTDLRLFHRYQKRGERIRELEAELACLEQELAYHRRTTDKGILKAFDVLKARAEKAEAEIEIRKRDYVHLAEVVLIRMEQRAQKAENELIPLRQLWYSAKRRAEKAETERDSLAKEILNIAMLASRIGNVTPPLSIGIAIAEAE